MVAGNVGKNESWEEIACLCPILIGPITAINADAVGAPVDGMLGFSGVLLLLVVCSSGQTARNWYQVVDETRDACLEFELRNTGELESTVLHYTARALHSFYVRDGHRRIRFHGNTSRWSVSCTSPDATKADCFTCSLDLQRLGFYYRDNSTHLPR